MDVLDLIEHRKKEVGAALAEPWTFRNCHPSHRAWAETAVTNYLAARTAEEESRRAAGHPATFPVRDEWVAISKLAAADARGRADTSAPRGGAATSPRTAVYGNCGCHL